MLLANHVHLEAACPVLALPDALPLDPRLLAALERADGATVHVLHDASPEGVTLPARVRAALGPVPGSGSAPWGSYRGTPPPYGCLPDAARASPRRRAPTGRRLCGRARPRGWHGAGSPRWPPYRRPGSYGPYCV